ncbi:MAG: RNA methyltransferase [Parvularculaceae bacterium]
MSRASGDQRVSRREGRKYLSPAPVFVLVEPQMGENIGAAARAMLNFGVSGLRLVNPRDGWPNPKAGAMAAGASIVIDQAEIFSSLDAAIADRQYVIAATARRRELPTPVLAPAEAAQELAKRIGAGQRCAVLFGGERNGLSSGDIARADAILSVPVNPSFSSINLAQAAAIVAYEWFLASVAAREAGVRPAREPAPAGRDDLEHLFDHLEAELDAAGYFFPPEKAPQMKRNLRAAFSRAGFTEPEVRSLHGVVKALVKRRGQ